ncbi:MAG: A/G-specific adenine glycosylase [bacterium]
MGHHASLSQGGIQAFRKRIYDHFLNHGRSLPWRTTNDPYHIFVSEVMLQQTQVDRVIGKYTQFLAAFPAWSSLAEAPFDAVLAVWQGLGYNRRALSLKNAAAMIMEQYNGILPSDPDLLARLPGIGKATAASIAVFAFNEPVIFVETNIRSVFIHHFFERETDVPDAEILPLVEATLDGENPRRWYSALMDYGTALKRTHPNPSRRSLHYQKQSPFTGSTRQIRGLILKELLAEPYLTKKKLTGRIRDPLGRVPAVLETLCMEGMVTERKKHYRVGKGQP